MFLGGCGRFFEGDATQMNRALNEVLANLDNETVNSNCSRNFFTRWRAILVDVEGPRRAIFSDLCINVMEKWN